jgi:hypothetical protein
MRQKHSSDRRCIYVVPLEEKLTQAELESLALYLTSLGLAGYETLVLDAAEGESFEQHGRVLRWVAGHVAVSREHRTASGAIDPVHAADDFASADSIVVAGTGVRYTTEQLETVCSLLQLHEVVEPQDYIDPLPWWSAIDAGRVLLHRSLEPFPDHGSTFGFRRGVVRGLRGIDAGVGDDHVRRLAAQGAEVFSALDLFIRRSPASLHEWMGERVRQAEDDFSLPMKSAFFFALIPMIVVLTLIGGAQMAAGYSGAIAFAAVMLAFRGRFGARAFFPVIACLFAPLWVLERSLSVYWALAARMRGPLHEEAETVTAGRAAAEKIAREG